MQGTSFTYEGDIVEASNWLPFARQKQLNMMRIGAMIQSYNPTDSVMITVRTTPAHIHIKAESPIDIVIKDSGTGLSFVAVREGDSVSFKEFNKYFGTRLSWANGRNLACSADLPASTVVISGEIFIIPNTPGRTTTLRAITAFTKKSGAIVERSYIGVGTANPSMTVAVFEYNKETEDVEAEIIYSAPIGELWNNCIFSKDTSKNKIELIILRDSVSLEKLTLTYDSDNGGYNSKTTVINTSSMPTEETGILVRTSVASTDVSTPWSTLFGGTTGWTGGELDYDNISYSTSLGVIYDPPLVCDTFGFVSVPVTTVNEYEKTNTVLADMARRRDIVLDGFGNVVSDTSEIHGTTTFTNMRYKNNVLGVFGSNLSSLNSTENYSSSTTLFFSDTDEFVPPDDSLVTLSVSNSFAYRDIIFADRYVRVYLEQTYTQSEVEAEASWGVTSSYDYTHISDENMIVEVNGSVAFKYPSQAQTITATGSLNGNNAANAVPVSPITLVTTNITTSLIESDSSTPAMGDAFVYNNSLYAVRVRSPFGSGTTANPNKILFFPIDNGVIKPTVIGVYNYTNHTVYMGLHTD